MLMFNFHSQIMIVGKKNRVCIL